MGAHPFVTPPIWTMEGETLNIETQISYLGTVLGKKCGTSHCESRIRGATTAFYGVQGAGIKFPGVAPHIMIDIYNTAIRSILTYGCTTTYLTKTNLLKLDRYQGKILKQCLGLNNRSGTTPLLKAMCVWTHQHCALYVCVCVCVCVRAGGRSRGRARVRACVCVLESKYE